MPPGFKLHLFAGEPDVKQPSRLPSMIAVASGWPRPTPILGARRKARQRSHPVFEDTNGDHKFDKRTVFMEGLNLVSGWKWLWRGVGWRGALLDVHSGQRLGRSEPAASRRFCSMAGISRPTPRNVEHVYLGTGRLALRLPRVFCPRSLASRHADGTAPARRRRGVAYHPTKQLFEVFAEGRAIRGGSTLMNMASASSRPA